MTKKLGGFLLCVLFASLTTVWAVAQDDTSNASKGQVRNITGCLTKAGGGDEYLLTATDGSTWEIHDKNSASDLAAHANQTVEVRGVVSHEKAHNMKEDAKDMAHDTGATGSHPEHGHLTVTKLHKVSDTCRQ
jgi:hypothetical protein